MAFEVPLEADRIDGELNFFSTIARAPVIGTLFWMLGGGTGDDDNDKQDDSVKRSFSKGAGLKKAAPSLVGSEVSVTGDELFEIQGSLDALWLDKGHRGLPRKKELSWSDETGKDLVCVMDESSIPVHEPKPSAEMPVRSAMSRSRSVCANANRLEQPEKPVITQKQHIPIDPFASGTSGIDSPQWGWYINTTPPTPEMYYSRPQKSRKQPDSMSDTSEASIIAAMPPTSDYSMNDAALPKYQANPIFQGLQDRNRAVPLDWPSVPL